MGVTVVIHRCPADAWPSPLLANSETISPDCNRAAASPVAGSRLESDLYAEHQALETGDKGRALSLSGLFHIAVADIAGQQVFGTIIQSLISRSSLIIALYWRRPDTTCESPSHHALLDAFRTKDGQAAEEIMKSHIVDLHSGLDLSGPPSVEQSLAEALKS